MFGGKYLNNWRMAELHAKEAPDRARELEHWGAVFDRTPERVMSQRAFGGHTYKRLVHIGDRTGLEMIRTLQDRTVHSDVDVFMETTITRLIKDGDRVVGCVRLPPRQRRADQLQRQGAGDRDRRQRPHLQDHVELAGLHRRRLRAGATRPAPSWSTWSSSSSTRPAWCTRPASPAARDRGGPRRGRDPAQQRRRALHGALRPQAHGALDPRRGRALDLHRGQGGARHARTAASTSTSATSTPTTSSASCRACTTSSWSWPASTSPRSRCRSARPATTSWAASRSTRHRRVARAGPVRDRRGQRRHERRQPPGRQLARRPARVRPPRR